MNPAAPLALAIVLSATSPAFAQKDPAQTAEWGAMFNRMDKIIGPYQAKLGLPHYWNTYCLNRVGAEEDAHPKNGDIPLGVSDWRSMPPAEFKRTLSVLEEWRTSAMLLCLADVKARLNAAEGH
jgi:hypothetical protein